MTQRCYSAFVSYSHKDDKWTKWLLSALETYRVPRHLVGTEGGNGTVPAKLTRIFRDREELAAGAHLDANIQEALEQSQTLLVVCSPNAVHSLGVNQEIKQFRKMRGDDHIFYIIKDGEPHARARGLDPDLECFPKALLDHHLETATSYGVPLAADARAKGDGKKMALLKVVAGILGVNLDSLVRRDLQRRQWRLWGVTALAATGMLLTTSLAVQTYFATKRAEDALLLAQQEQDETESLIQYISESINRRLWRLGEADLTKSVTERMIDHYEGQNGPFMGPQETARKIRSMRSLLRTNLVHGQHVKVIALVEETAKTTRSLLEASPDDLTLIDSHAQALQILATSYAMAGECEKAKQVAEERLSVGTAMRARDDAAFYMRASLGNALVDRGFLKLNCELQPKSAVHDFNAALEIRQEMANQIEEWIGSLAGGYRFLGLGYEMADTLEASINAHQQSQELYERYMTIKPDEVLVEFIRHKFALEMAETMINAGQIDGAIKKISLAKNGISVLTAKYPDNRHWAAHLIFSDYLLGTAAFINQEYETALRLFSTSSKSLEKLMGQLDKSVANLNGLFGSKISLAATNLAIQRTEEAEKLLNEVTVALESSPERFFNSIAGRKMMAHYHTTIAALHQEKGDLGRARKANQAVITAYGKHRDNVHPAVRFALMKAYIDLGQAEVASEIAANLKGIGFKRADFERALTVLSQMETR